MPFSDDISIWSWNARRLFGVDHYNAKQKQDKVRWARNNFDIVFVQESHCGDYLEDTFVHEFVLTHRCWPFPVPGNHAAGGLLIFCKLVFSSIFQEIEEVVIDQGRIAGLEMQGDDGALQFRS